MFSKFKRPKWIRHWHRWLGILVAFPWIWLAITGLILRQEENWKLNVKNIHSKQLLKHYGVWPDEEPINFLVAGTKNQFVSLWGGTLYKDGNPLGTADSLTGAASSGADLAVSTNEEILIYNANLEYLDQLGELTLGVSQISTIGAGGKSTPVLFKGSDGLYALTKDYLSVSEVGENQFPNREFSEGSQIPENIQNTIERHYAKDVGISYSRLILDLHSGNFFGTFGKLVIDLSAFFSIILTILGLLLVKKKWKSASN